VAHRLDLHFCLVDCDINKGNVVLSSHGQQLVVIAANTRLDPYEEIPEMHEKVTFATFASELDNLEQEIRTQTQAASLPAEESAMKHFLRAAAGLWIGMIPSHAPGLIDNHR